MDDETRDRFDSLERRLLEALHAVRSDLIIETDQTQQEMIATRAEISDGFSALADLMKSNNALMATISTLLAKVAADFADRPALVP